MPSRTRTIGPEGSEMLAEVFKEARLKPPKLSMPALSLRMIAYGYEISPATINAIENGIITGGHRRTRMITVDEMKAFVRVLQIPPQVIIDWLYDQEQELK